MAKEFNKKFMHPTRRKLVDMVMTGEDYENNTQISFSGADKQIIKRKVGEKWTDDDGKSWEQLEAGKVQTSELGDIMADARAYLDKLNSCKADDCKTIKLGRVDKKLVSKTGYCATCFKRVFPNDQRSQIIYTHTKEIMVRNAININFEGLGTAGQPVSVPQYGPLNAAESAILPLAASNFETKGGGAFTNLDLDAISQFSKPEYKAFVKSLTKDQYRMLFGNKQFGQLYNEAASANQFNPFQF